MYNIFDMTYLNYIFAQFFVYILHEFLTVSQEKPLCEEVKVRCTLFVSDGERKRVKDVGMSNLCYLVPMPYLSFLKQLVD